MNDWDGLQNQDLEGLEVEVLSEAEHAVRLLTKSRNLVEVLHDLSQKYGLRQSLEHQE